LAAVGTAAEKVVAAIVAVAAMVAKMVAIVVVVAANAPVDGWVVAQMVF
jgi:hypothetical protein